MLIGLFRYHFEFILLANLQKPFLTFSHSVFFTLSPSSVAIMHLYYFSKYYLIAYFSSIDPFNLSFLFLLVLLHILLRRCCLNFKDFYHLAFIGNIILSFYLHLEFV